MTERILPARTVSGVLCLPGDKSISHRYALIASLAEGVSRIRNYSTGADCGSTLGALRALGVEIARRGAEITIQGRGLEGLREPAGDLDAGNSGSTMRMLAGILAGQPFRSRIVGDKSLSRRPMGRIVEPLERMGAKIQAREGRFPPLEILGGFLRPIDYTLPVASAQVKTAVLFAGLFAEGETTVREPARSRDHTEIALRQFGADIRTGPDGASLSGRARLQARELWVPSDLSSAAFFIAAALLLPGSELLIRDVGLNPTRSALLDFLRSAGADIQVLTRVERNGELAGDLRIRASRLAGGVIEKDLAAALIDELPVLAVLGAASDEGLTVRDAAELRVKETDRIATVVENLRRMGVAAEASADGFFVPGGQRLRGAALDSFGDHRIAMAFTVAALAAEGESTMAGAGAAGVSFPEFYGLLRQVVR
ncbi:MAG: 3-phosphoshikimate 1-carboxyvinyltransferase [Acidobacteria bacterium]|nr:3-phosphoshikimate 1-carboxyvinyltransferase [Acidobacteriota bacterium]